MGLGSGPRQPGCLLQVAALFAAATLLLALLRQDGALLPSTGGALLLRTGRVPNSGSAAPAREQIRRRHVTAATCPTAEQVAAASPWARSCHHITRACVDQGTLVLFDARYQPKRANGTGGKEPPSFAADSGFGQFTHTYRNGVRQRNYKLATIRSRPAAQDEGAAALRNPSFSNCTVPVVWFPFWLTNFGHMLRDNGARLWGAVQDTPWGASIKLVPVTAEGQALPGMVDQLLQPITPLRVESWADFSARLAPGSEELVPPGPPPSAEGSHQRCFQNMLICTHGLDADRWPLHAYGQHVAEAYRHLLSPEVAQAVGTESSIRKGRGGGGSSLSGSGGGGGSSTVGSSSSAGNELTVPATVLNVVFQRRNGTTRQLLNAAELVQRCNQWQYTTADGRRLAAKCWEADITDLASGLTAALQADVMVGIHGANLANGWMMRPGSSMIEVQAFGFDQHPPHLQDPLINAQDSESQVLWWVLQGCDPSAWQPSPQEATSKGDPGAWAKNRSVLLRWEALDTALRQVAETGGDMRRYTQLWRSGRWWWHVRADSLEYGGDRKHTCALVAGGGAGRGAARTN